MYCLVWKKEVMLDDCSEAILVPVLKKSDSYWPTKRLRENFCFPRLIQIRDSKLDLDRYAIVLTRKELEYCFKGVRISPTHPGLIDFAATFNSMTEWRFGE